MVQFVLGVTEGVSGPHMTIDFPYNLLVFDDCIDLLIYHVKRQTSTFYFRFHTYSNLYLTSAREYLNFFCSYAPGRKDKNQTYSTSDDTGLVWNGTQHHV